MKPLFLVIYLTVILLLGSFVYGNSFYFDTTVNQAFGMLIILFFILGLAAFITDMDR